jgi:hypothetical protein
MWRRDVYSCRYIHVTNAKSNVYISSKPNQTYFLVFYVMLLFFWVFQCFESMVLRQQSPQLRTQRGMYECYKRHVINDGYLVLSRWECRRRWPGDIKMC